ncbi:hypothetical protein NLJ89_g6086 [Agrocybe chaxingu]|uniref:NmrA-like domain-containing protein n=1 Tax=Agrocybe chaxingu TaxID=84603 RepID=A0A9W8JZG5_9AGAR|nr:hypothetical protein NLJ89_g6086 [Agrocybe chaxingu]
MSTTADRQKTIFILGATGYLGSQFLVLLGRKSLGYHVVALVRNLDPEGKKLGQLRAIYEDLEVVEGTLEDKEVIEREAEKAKYVVNSASSDHPASVLAVLAGLTKQSAAHPGDPPLCIHVSGLGILHDKARGEFLEESAIPRYSDIGFDLAKLDPDAAHMNCDKEIAAAGARKENPIRTITAHPGWIYGVGEGITKGSAAIRVFLSVCKVAGFMGTWGPGYNAMSTIHVKDAANALLTIFEAALQGKADEGAEGHYFLSTDGPYVSMREVTKIIGDIMFKHGIYSQGGTQPLPAAATELFGESKRPYSVIWKVGWHLMGGNERVNPQRLKKLGWVPVETKKLPLLESLPAEVEVAIQEQNVLVQKVL